MIAIMKNTKTMYTIGWDRNPERFFLIFCKQTTKEYQLFCQHFCNVDVCFAGSYIANLVCIAAMD